MSIWEGMTDDPKATAPDKLADAGRTSLHRHDRRHPERGAEMSNWQPIDTAPKTGQMIDLWCTGPGKDGPNEQYRIPDAFWLDGAWWSHSLGELKRSHPTHWMFRPKSPQP